MYSNSFQPRVLIHIFTTLVLVLFFCNAPSMVAASCTSVDCTLGQYFSNETQSCLDCMPGYYCDSALSSPTPCSPGTYNPNTGRSDSNACLTCPSGEYQVSYGQSSCVSCPKGSSCSDPSQSPVPCSAGRYTPGSGLATSCSLCPAGHRCPTPTADPDPCPLGQYYGSAGTQTSCLSCGSGYYTPSTGQTSCTACEKGYSCPDGTSRVACTSGSYTSITGRPSCDDCPAGYSCPSTSGEPQACAAGTYSTNGDHECHSCTSGYYQSSQGKSSCSPCPSGHECSDSTVDPRQCGAGQYSQSLSTTCSACEAGTYASSPGSSACQGCPAGYSCADPSQPPTPCADGFYSPANSTVCLACSPGTYSSSDHSSCPSCPLGHECSDPQVGPVPCPQGKYADSQGKTTCDACPAGYSCWDPTLSPVECTDGWSSSGSSNCTRCPYNMDCSSKTAITSCQSGTYSPEGTLGCLSCPAGVHCRPTFGSCPTGSYSTIGDDYCHTCPAGFSCSNSSQPIACDTGTYSLDGQITCSPCPAGHFCNSTSLEPQLCPDGSYSTGGTVTSCTLCSAGFYCPDKTVNLEVPCQQGFYSVAGQRACDRCPPGMACTSSVGYSPSSCASGTYSLGGQSTCTPCPAGSYCEDATQLPLQCTPGYYSAAQSINCTKCPAGYSCADPSQDPQTCGVGTYSTSGSIACLPCSGGVTCSLGATSPLDGTLCPAGSYCPPGASQPTPCPLGTYGNVTGQTQLQKACYPCPIGKVCPQGTVSVDDSSYDCQAGYYCPSGTRLADEFPCPAGTYNPNTGATSINNCLTCPPGYYCPVASTGYSLECHAGHYCLNGTTHPREYPCPAGTYNPNVGATSLDNCITCTAGYYCGLAATAQTACPRGTYSPTVNATASEYCFPCPPGWACSDLAMTDPYIYPCSVGHYCPSGTASPTEHPCPAGTYTDATNLTRIEDCQLCLQGYACEPGTGGTLQTPHLCSQGFYCPGVASLDPPTYFSEISSVGSGSYYAIPGLAVGESQFPCPAGTYGTFSGASHKENCTQCPGGSYCAEGAGAISGPCSAGYVCPAGSKQPTAQPCLAGTYSSYTNLSATSECSNCPVGHYCREHATAPVPCPIGTYAPNSNTKDRGPVSTAAEEQCVTCPAGYYCPSEGLVTPLECGVGKYSISGESSCRTCPRGYYCPSNTTTKTQLEQNYVCPGGLYCDEGLDAEPTTSSHNCPISHYCPPGTQYPLRCPAGTYNPDLGLTNSSQCTICPAGYYCLEGASNYTGQCDPGFYCPSGSTGSKQKPCPGGRYANFYGADASETCTICPSGKYCPPGTFDPIECTRGYYCPCGSTYPEPCPIGSYGNRTGVTSVEGCTKCPPGQYCDGVGETYPTGPCDAGYYCIEGAYTSQPPGLPTGGLCPRGGYCVLGSRVPESCLPGTYNNFTGAKSAQECISCTAGYYCFGSNNPAPTGPCQAGYFCNGSASTPTQFVTPAGSYTFEGASTPIPCPQGSYNPLPAQSNCTLCDSGFYCPTTGLQSKTNCPQGSYCPQGSVIPTPCPAGTYSDQENLMAKEDCLDCPAGKYCEKPGLTAPSGLCAAGHYCTGKTSRSNPITIPGDPQNGDVCQPGRYCINGTTNVDQYRCPPGTYSPSTGNAAISDCLPCKPGYYCDVSGITDPVSAGKICSAGFYCISGAKQATPVDGVTGAVCPNGTFCVAGSSSPESCPLGYYQSQTQKSSCLICPEGYYCSVSSGTVNPAICPAGRYCKEGTSIPEPCPSGTYSSSEGLRNVTECTLCSGGKYCGSPGLTAPTDDCEEGFYCTSGAKTPTGTIDSALGGSGGTCQPGYYCPRGSSLQKPCPAGTYSPSSANPNITSCLSCPPGRYCELQGLSAVSGLCDAGFYCSGGAVTKAPTPDGSTGGQCPPGTYCPSGSFAPNPCDAGYYQNSAARSSCLTCPEGFFCNNTVSGTSAPVVCPRGYYCPEGSGVFLLECPRGSFSNKNGLKEVSQCTLCTGGRVCSVSALTEPDGDCLAGYYCTSGARSQTGDVGVLGGVGGICPKGSYCPTRSSTSTSCLAGTYQPSEGARNSTACLPCTSGSYCAINGLQAPTAKCSAGCYCSGGASSACPTSGSTGGSCTPGHYCPEGSIAPVPCSPGNFTQVAGRSTCDICPAGSYCPSATVNPKDCPAGRYCPGGVGIVIPQCPKGTFSNKTALVEESQCSLCTGGQFCSIDGLTAPNGECAAGYYCTRGALDNVGTLGTLGGASGSCPAGRYCPKGSTIPVSCPFGTFSPITNLGAESECSQCTTGKYCGLPGLTTPSGPCSAGFYCPPAQSNPDPAAYVCPRGYYCPEQSSLPVGCPDGTYQPAKGASTCVECPSGYYCKNNASTPIICPASYYCPNGTGDPLYCSNGTYSLVSGLSSNSQCIPCPAGKWCALGQVIGDCSAGFQCKLGSDTPTPPYAPDTNSRGGLCPKGFYCPIGTVTPERCPDGSFSDQVGAADQSVCGPCGAGYICFDGSSQKLPCPVGRYCPLAAAVGDCPISTFNPSEYGKNSSACQPCTAGYYCPNTAMSSVSSYPCPIGNYCPQGSSAPTQCPGGTYRADTRAAAVSNCAECPAGYYCPQGSSAPLECVSTTTNAYYCPAGSSQRVTCPAGKYCGRRTSVPIDCPAGYYCPVNTHNPIFCPDGYYCPTSSGQPIQCPFGYQVKNDTVGTIRSVLSDVCQQCPPGTYGNDPQRKSCLPCSAGYYCQAGATHPETIQGISSNVFVCPVGYYCLSGDSSPRACGKGEYQSKRGQTSCLKCPAGLNNPYLGASKCQICGPNSYSLEGAETCICNGTGRAYQNFDGMCICEPGYIFYNEDFSISDDSDAATDCQPFIYDRCNTGSNTARDIVGNCVPSDSSSCSSFCRYHGGSGTIESELGVCECRSIVNEDEICDPNCRASQLKLVLDPLNSKVNVYDPVTTTNVASFSYSQVTSGLPVCANDDSCDIELVQMTTQGFRGVYDPQYSYFTNLFNHSLLSTIGTNLGVSRNSLQSTATRKLLQSSTPQYVDQQGILQPTVCLPYGGGLMWDVSHPSREHYPVYMKDALLNTVPDFDFGPFRQLDGLMRSNLTMTTFVYMFSQPGVYVFQDGSDQDSIMIVRVMNSTEQCPSTAAFRPITTTNLVSLGIKRRSGMLLAPDWLLVMLLLISFLFFIGVLIVGIHYFRTRTWKAGRSSKVRFRKMLPLSDIESKGIGFAQRQLYTSRQKGDNENVVEDDSNFVDLEGFSIKMFYDKLNEHKNHLNSSMNDYKDEFTEKYNKILEETQEIKDLLSKSPQNTVFTVDINQMMDRLKNADSKDEAKNIVQDLKTQLNKLVEDQGRKQPFDPKKSDLPSQDIKKVYNLDLEEDQNRNAAINQYNLLISRLDDRLTDMDTMGEDGDVTSMLDHFNKTLDSSKMIISKSLDKMNANIREKDNIQHKADDPFSQFNLSDDMAQSLKDFLNSQLQQLFSKYTALGQVSADGEIPAGDESGGVEQKTIENDENQEDQDEEEGQTDDDASLFEESDVESEPESDDEKDDEITALEKKQKRRRIALHHQHRTQLEELNTEMEEEYKTESNLVVERIDEHTRQTLEQMKENINKTVRNKDLTTEEKKKILDNGRKSMEDYKNKMEAEKQKQLDDLKDALRKKNLNKFKALKRTQRSEKQDAVQDDETDRAQLKKLLDNIENNKDKYGTGVQAEMQKQKDLLRQKLELRKAKRDRQQENARLQLKNLLDEHEHLDKQFAETQIEKINNRLVSLKKEELEDQIQNGNLPKQEKEQLMKNMQNELDTYKKQLQGKKKKQLEELEERVQARNKTKTQKVEKKMTLEEQADIKDQEKDLDNLRKIMSQFTDGSSSRDSALDEARKKQAEALQSKLEQMAKERAMKEKAFEKEEKRVEESLGKEKEKEQQKVEQQASKQYQEEEQKLKKELEEQLQQCSSQEEKEALIKMHNDELQHLKKSFERSKTQQVSDIERRLEERRQRQKERLEAKKKQALKDDLLRQEHALNDLTKNSAVLAGDAPPVSPKIEVTQRDTQKEERLKNAHSKEIQNLQQTLEQKTREEIKNIEQESETVKKSLEEEQSEKKRLLEEKAKFKAQKSTEEDRARIMGEFQENVNNLEKQYKTEAERQQAAIQQKLALRKKQIAAKNKEELEHKKREQQEKERKLRRQHVIKAEKETITDLITDQNSSVTSVEQAITQVLHPRQLKELDDMKIEQEKEMQQKKQQGASNKELDDLQLYHTDQRVKLKQEHVNEKKELEKHFEEYSKLLESRNQQNKFVDEELKKFAEQIDKQKQDNMTKIESQKEELKQKMQEEIEKMKAEMEKEKEKMRKMIEDEKNKLSVKQLMEEKEKEVQQILEQQKNLEKDERERLLEQHKMNMESFENALEAERKRQEDILKSRINEIMDRDLRKKREQAEGAIDQEFNLEIQQSKEKEEKQEAKSALREARSTVSLMSLIADRGQRKPRKVHSDNEKKPAAAAAAAAAPPAAAAVPKLSEEQTWLGPILQKLTDIESLLLSEKRPYIDARDQHIRNEGRLEQIPETALSLRDLVFYRFGQFVVRLLRSKFPFLPEVQLLIAKSLPLTQYTHNAFRNSFFYDRKNNTLFIREHRFNNIGKLIVIIVHCLAHIGMKDMTNDENPRFAKYFYTMMEVVCEDMFLLRQPLASITEENKQQILDRIGQMAALPGSTTPQGLHNETTTRAPMQRTGTTSIMAGIASQSGHDTHTESKQIEMRKLRKVYRELKEKQRNAKEGTPEYEEIAKQMLELKNKLSAKP